MKKAMLCALFLLFGYMVVAYQYDDTATMNCEAMDLAFFQQSIRQYFSNKGESIVDLDLSFISRAHYSSVTHWWSVPFNKADTQYLALLSCDGRLELSIRTP